MEIKVVYRDLVLGDVPMSASSLIHVLNQFFSNLISKTRIGFASPQPVVGLRLTPSVCFDRHSLYVDGSYQRTILETTKSPWIDALHAGERASREQVSERIKHFLIPSDDGVWEILAERCNRR